MNMLVNTGADSPPVSPPTGESEPEAAAPAIPVAVASVPIKDPPEMDTAELRAELRELRADVKLNQSHGVLSAALVLARKGEGPFKPAPTVRAPSAAAAAQVITPQWRQAMSVRLIEMVLMLRSVMASISGGYTREHLDTPAPSPFTTVEQHFNFDVLIAWASPASGCEDFATDSDVLLPPAESARRTWSYLKTKWAGIKSDYTIPHGRWTASGQGDPEANFADFQKAQDPHPKVSLYLHHRLESLRAGLAPDDLASMDGMVSRLIRVDAISDNGSSNKRLSTGGASTSNKRVSAGGFLDTATKEDFASLFRAAAPPAEDTSPARMNMLLTHYPHLSNEVQADVDELLTETVAELQDAQRRRRAAARADSPTQDMYDQAEDNANTTRTQVYAEDGELLEDFTRHAGPPEDWSTDPGGDGFGAPAQAF